MVEGEVGGGWVCLYNSLLTCCPTHERTELQVLLAKQAGYIVTPHYLRYVL